MKGSRAAQAYDAAMKHAEAEKIAEVAAARRRQSCKQQKSSTISKHSGN